MLNITGKYVTVFSPSIRTNVSDKILFATLSSSKKNVKDGAVSYDNMTWSAKFVGGAFEKAKSLKELDKIDILKGAITNKYDKDSKRLFVEVTVFDFVMSAVSNGKGD